MKLMLEDLIQGKEFTQPETQAAEVAAEDGQIVPATTQADSGAAASSGINAD